MQKNTSENTSKNANPELIETLKVMAETGDYESQKVLAHIYFESEGVEKDLDVSLYYSQISTENDECIDEEKVTILDRMGRIFCEKKEYERALKLFANAHDLCKDAKHKDELYFFIADTYRCLKDGKYEDMFKLIIERTDPQFPNNILKSVFRLLGAFRMKEGNYLGSCSYYTQAVKLGEDDAEILNNTGYASEMCGKNKEAIMYYMLSSAKGCLFADLNLGYMYENGLGVPKDEVTAAKHYEKGKEELSRWKEARGIKD
jgi:TPR repeat protein